MRVRMRAAAVLGAVVAAASLANGWWSSAAPAQAATLGPAVRVCPPPTAGTFTCFAFMRSATVRPFSTPAGYSPTDLASAYNLPATGNASRIAIVEIQDYPTLEADLAVYRTTYGLPACTSAGGCLRKMAQDGTTNYPPPDALGAAETAIDTDMVSAVCAGCGIDVIEATSNNPPDIWAAVDQAVATGDHIVSISLGTQEYPGETADEVHFNHPGVQFLVASGDQAGFVSYPASSAYVTAVGGTTLLHTPSGSRAWSETAWSDASAGCSLVIPKPAWQHDTLCARRMVADVSATADPTHGVAFYDSYQGPGGWAMGGGTSVAAPVVAGVVALGGAATTLPQGSYPYSHTAGLYDVVGGSTGSCGTYVCNAVAGYDGPTGLGTPDGLTAFGGPATGTTPTSTTSTTTPGSTVVVNRLGGTDRIATAVAVSQAGFPAAGSAAAVVLARSDDFADALSGGALAAALKGPLLVTPSASLDPRVDAEIHRALPAGGTVHVLGGPAAVADATVTALTKEGFTVDRIAGADRFATAAAVAVPVGTAPPVVLLANGLAFPDALTASAVAGATHGVILLSDGSTPSPATTAYLAAHPSATVYALGGPAAAAYPTATGLVGADRYATAAAVATKFFPQPTLVGLASGLSFADGLAGGAFLGSRGAPLLLSAPTGVSAAVTAYLQANAKAATTSLDVFGGVLALAPPLVSQVTASFS